MIGETQSPVGTALPPQITSSALPDPPPGEALVLTGDTILAFHPLTYLDEEEETTVGCGATGSYAILPADGAALLRQLEGGLTLDQAAAWYAQSYGQTPDIAEFAETLAELDFLRRADSVPGPAAPLGPVGWQRLGRAVFSVPGAACMTALAAAAAAAAAVAVIRDHALLPANHDLFFTRYIAVIEIVVFLGQFPLLLIHESFHALAGRRLGLHSTLSVGRRLYYVLFLTTMDGLVAVPRRKRYLPMLAGLIADTLVVAALTLAAAALAGPGGVLGVAAGICLALAYTTLLRMLWQAYFYLQTDLYFVVVTIFGCVQLQATARAILLNRWNRLRRRPDRVTDLEAWHPRDREVARWYSWFVLIGYTVSLASLPVVVVPIGYRMLSTVADRLIHPAGHGAADLADSAVFLALNAAQLVVIAWLIHRERAGRTSQPRSQEARP